MKKVFQFIGFAIVFIIIGVLIDRFYLKPKSVVIDDKDIPEELEDVEAKPSKIKTEIRYFEDTAKKEWLEDQIRILKKALKEAENKKVIVEKIESGEMPKDTIELGIKWQVSSEEFRWTVKPDGRKLVLMSKPYTNDWYVRLNVKAYSFTPVQLYGLSDNEVRWKKHYEDFREPQIAQQIYNRGAVGMIKGVAGTAALFSGNEYVAGSGMFIIVDEAFGFGVIDFLYNLIN